MTAVMPPGVVEITPEDYKGMCEHDRAALDAWLDRRGWAVATAWAWVRVVRQYPLGLVAEIEFVLRGEDGTPWSVDHRGRPCRSGSSAHGVHVASRIEVFYLPDDPVPLGGCRCEEIEAVVSQESRIFRSNETYEEYCARAQRNGLRPCSIGSWYSVLTAGRPDFEPRT